MLRDLRHRFRALFRRSQVNDELDEELRAHVEHETAKYLRSGFPADEARRRPLIALGGMEQTRQQTRDSRGTGMIEQFHQDLCYGLRFLGRNRAFTGVFIVTLGLGIGSCTAIFSLMNAVMFPPLPYGNVGRLVYITTPNRNVGEVPPDAFVPDNADFADMKRESSTFTAMTQFRQEKFNLDHPGLSLSGAAVDAAFFSTLEVAPELGRAINAADNQPDNASVVVISHTVWQQLFNGDRAVLGKSLQLSGKFHRVIGVMAAGFNYPRKSEIDEGDSHIDATDVWVPLALAAKQRANRGLSGDNYALGRLKQGVSVRQAEDELSSIMQRLDPLHDPSTFRQGWYAYVKSFRQQFEGSSRPLLLLLMGAVSFVLLIACGNAASLLLARNANRIHEMGVRATLGAGRSRLVRQLLTESLLLGTGGGLVGIVLAWVFLRLLLRLDPGNIPRLQEASLNGEVLAFAVSIMLLTSLFAGILPAIAASRVNLIEFLKSGGQTGPKGERGRFRSVLIVAQIAIVVVLLTGSGLLVKSLIRLQQVPLGFSTTTLSMKINLPESYTKPTTPEKRESFYRSLNAQIAMLPGTFAVGAVDNLPFGDTKGVGTFWVENYPNQEGQMTDGGSVTPDYFSAMGVPIIEGRAFTASDALASPTPAIVNRTFAKKYFAGRDAVGGKILPGNPAVSPQDSKNPRVVVGVVADMRDWSLESPPQPQLFLPFQDPDDAYIVIRTALPPKDVVQSATTVLHRIDARLSFSKVHSMRELVSEASARRRFQTVLMSIFAAMATTLALIGFYGLLSYTASRRGPEMGIRIALGANRSDILRLFLGQGLRVVALGLAIGLGAAFALTQFLSSSLYEVRTSDPATFVLVPVLLLVAALVASLVPAQRAANSDPMIILRRE
ncbi:MAG TPA: ABC transporter permease [Terracidiphilus sp.]|nr:ABC transporter permease [Terracidiphilus sp.]